MSDEASTPINVSPEPIEFNPEPIERTALPPWAVSPRLLTGVQLALHVGWTMALLYTDSPVSQASRPLRLPTVHELGISESRDLELDRMRRLLNALAATPECAGSGLPTDVPAEDARERPFKDRLEELNLKILRALAAASPDIELAYEVGRSLRDTANPPRDGDDTEPSAGALARQLTHDRVSKLQESLTALGRMFPVHAAAIVATSIGRWSEFAAVTVAATRPRLKRNGQDEAVATMCRYLLSQGELWLMLLIDTRKPSEFLSSEGYIAAADATLHRASKTLQEVLRHYWLGLVGLAAVTAGFVYLAVANLSGGAKVWTSIAAVAGSLGISARRISSVVTRIGSGVVGWAAQAERPIWSLAEEDAMAWAITTLPKLRLTARGIWQLRRAGVVPPSSLGRIRLSRSETSQANAPVHETSRARHHGPNGSERGKRQQQTAATIATADDQHRPALAC